MLGPYGVGQSRVRYAVPRGSTWWSEGGCRAFPTRVVLHRHTTNFTPVFWSISLPGSKNEMYTAVCLNDVAHFPNLQGKGGVLESLLHLSGAKGAEIPAFASGVAVGKLFCELSEFFGGSVDLRPITSEDVDSFGLRTGDFGLGRG